MLRVCICGVLLAMAVSVSASGQTAAPAPGAPPAAAVPNGTLVVRQEQAGTISIDGKDVFNGQAGQVMNFHVQAGKQLVSLQPDDGKAVHKEVHIKAGQSEVESIGGVSLLHFRFKEKSSEKSANKPSEQPVSHPAADLQRARVRIAALHLLGLYQAEIDEAKKFHVANADPTTEESLKKIDELPGKMTSTTSLLGLGMAGKAFAHADEDFKS